VESETVEKRSSKQSRWPNERVQKYK